MRLGTFVRDTLAVGSSQILTRIMVVARGLIAAAALGPTRYGGWNALSLIFEYGGYAGLGAVQGQDLTLPGAVERGDSARAGELMRAAWGAVVTGGALFTVLLFAYLAAGGDAFRGAPGDDLPWLMLLAALIQLAFQYGGSALRAHRKIQQASLANAVQAVVGGGLGIALVWTYGIRGMLWGWLVGSLAGWIVLARAGREIPWIPGSPRQGLAVARAGLPMFGFFLATLVLRSVDRLALVHFASPHALGLYSLGLIVSSTLLHVPESVATVLLPRLASAAAGARDAERTRAEAIRVQRALTVLLPIVATFGVVLLEPVIARLLPEYRPGMPALRALAVGALLLAAGTVPAYVLLADRNTALRLEVGWAGALGQAVLVFAWAARDPRPESVAVAASLGFGLFSAVLVGLVAARWTPDPSARLRIVVFSFAPSLIMGAALLVACSFGDGASPWIALLRLLAVAAVGAVVLAGFGRGLLQNPDAPPKSL